MGTCAVRCYECGILMWGKDPSRIDYRMKVMAGRLRALCPKCYEEWR